MKALAFAGILAIGPIGVYFTALCKPPATVAFLAGMFASFFIMILIDKLE